MSRSTWQIATGQEAVPGRRALALLGGGDRCEVYLVCNESRGSPTVVKVLRPALVGDSRARRGLAREAQILATLDHPGAARFISAELDSERPALEIEYIAGSRLSTHVRHDGPLPLDAVAALGHQLAAVLAAVHSAGIVHLDVKPSNVIVNRGVARLIDFSVARRVERAQRINGFVGTDAFMSPEQADQDRWSTIGAAADVWGLGATLYVASRGQRPFPKGRRDAVGRARFPQLAESPAPLDADRHSGVLMDLIMSTLAPRPEERPSMAELCDRFGLIADRAGVGNVRFR